MQFGLILFLPITGAMTDSLGWASPFYLVGVMTCIWFGFWIYLVHSSPDEHPRISKVILNNMSNMFLPEICFTVF